MNDTETRTDEEIDALVKVDAQAGVGQRCPVCGKMQIPRKYKGFLPPEIGDLYALELPYAHNTCSQDCARTAAIVEAINGWRLASMPTYRTLTLDSDPLPG
jgi:hypothetical protein